MNVKENVEIVHVTNETLKPTELEQRETYAKLVAEIDEVFTEADELELLKITMGKHIDSYADGGKIRI